MDALGAFDRSLIVVCSPTGTGYINYVMAETVEFLTRGDCAIVTVQYSLRPSFLSLDRVKVGRANVIALLAALDLRLQQIPEDRRPRSWPSGRASARTPLRTHRCTRAWPASPGGASSARCSSAPRTSRAGPGSGGPTRWAPIRTRSSWRSTPTRRSRPCPSPDATAARIFLVSHDEDPITKFGPDLALQRPTWLDPDRGKRPAGIPPEMEWRPLTTFFVTIADVLNSMTVIPGQFGAEGHDYRADLARFVSTAPSTCRAPPRSSRPR